ncbi:tetratricopeptide repeat protein [Bacteroides sp.]|uniref:tetratricopeptide repeat protein n=1 Tax=Bacteroides sp. TaxID=29523 RepID=UPI002616714D|nr:tetratricopeptide repeat protein [Bacteroides sp.]
MNLMKVKKILLLFILLLPVLAGANTQQHEVDSLESILKKHTTEDTTKINLLNKIACVLSNHNAKKSRSYAEQSEGLSKKLHYQKGEAESLWIIGLAIRKSDRKRALEYFGNAIEIARNTKNDELIMKLLYNVTRELSNDGGDSEDMRRLHEVVDLAKKNGDNAMLGAAYRQLGFIHGRQNNFPAAAEYYLSALKINEQIKNQTGIFYSLLNVAAVQADQKDLDAAVQTSLKAYLLAKKENNRKWIILSHIRLGGLYIGRNPSYALQHHQKALALTNDSDVSDRAIILTKIGRIYINKGDYDKAMTVFDDALTLATKKGLKRTCSELWHAMGVIYLKQKDYDKAISYTLKSLALAEKTKLPDLEIKCYEQLSTLYAETGAFNKAYQNQVLLKALNDSIFNEKNTRKIAFLESSYKYDKERQTYEMEKASQSMAIRNQKQIILFLIIVSSLILFLAFAIYWFNKLKKKVLQLKIENINHELEMNQKAMAAATLKLVQNSERDANSIKILENVEKNTVEESQKEIKSLIADYKFKSYNSNWEEFEIMFEKINTSFYEKLNTRYPTLTPNERKLCVFLKLNMSNNHISQITFQSEEALKKARLRLRKKLEIDRDVNLTAFIQSL